ncbi:chitin synthase-domain-containing protein [Neocallimastix lanati (nom. inval.)]|jgi:chitin synthase|nr:chitin synthase-domain-containing protein [Neocallimastix sp. JGI-2020a]
MAETVPLRMGDNNIEIVDITSIPKKNDVKGQRKSVNIKIPNNVTSMEVSGIQAHPDLKQKYYEETTQTADGQVTGTLIKHRNTLSRPERRSSHQRNLVAHDSPPPVRAGATTLRRKQTNVPQKKKKLSLWECIAKMATCCICSGCLKTCGGMTTPAVQQAWREKVTLCLICLIMMGFVGFITFAMQRLACPSDGSQSAVPWAHEENGRIKIPDKVGVTLIHGIFYSNKDLSNKTDIQLPDTMMNLDISDVFYEGGDVSKSKCKGYINEGELDCRGQKCRDTKILETVKTTGKQLFNWDFMKRLSNINKPNQLIVYDGYVLNLTTFFEKHASNFKDQKLVKKLQQNIGRDVTLQLSRVENETKPMECLKERFTVGFVSNQTMVCLAAQSFSVVFVVIILGIVLTKFFMAVVFHWIVADRFISKNVNGGNTLQDSNINLTSTIRTKSYHSSSNLLDEKSMSMSMSMMSNGNNSLVEEEDDGLLYTMCLVTCYSEGEQGIHNTLDSLSSTTYQDDHKLIFVIADGIIRGEGNNRYTPDIICGLMQEDNTLPKPQPQSYIAIASGEKQHNMAKVHAGYYISDDRKHRVPIINVVKCGTPNEAKAAKPGNRGKRDSQLILMNFLSRVMFNDRMTPLDFDLCTRIRHIAKVNPDQYELVLMVDADTKVKPSSLSYMVRAMYNDNLIMGLCGETRIANKSTSFWTCIQVFEYYISHHLGKGFESMFGGVTCLPGCFCMYRIKARKGLPGYYVPILANPDIVEEYSENIVDTLHKKNLLLLGEDRFLTTLMLKTFPKRKMVFIPHALCKTIVPDTFKVLLSQRRRWINSTIHNLLELVLVRDLCGTFCFSMQFVVAVELSGTVVLPAAIIFTIYLILYTIFSGNVEWVPILMLIAILGLPGVLIVITSLKWSYVGWMFVYLISLPIWNFVLPSYAMWHFDDFSWGETRKVQGAGKDDHGNKDGEFDSTSVPLKHWAEYERERLGIKNNSVFAGVNPGSIHFNNTSFKSLSPTTGSSNTFNNTASQVMGINHRTTSGQANLSTNPAVLRAVQLQQKQMVQMQLARQNNGNGQVIRRFSSSNSSSSASPLIGTDKSVRSKSSTAISSLSNKSSMANMENGMKHSFSSHSIKLQSTIPGNGQNLNQNANSNMNLNNPNPNSQNNNQNSNNHHHINNNNNNNNSNGGDGGNSFIIPQSLRMSDADLQEKLMINDPKGDVTNNRPNLSNNTLVTETSQRNSKDVTHLNIKPNSPPPVPPNRGISKQ